MTNNTKFAVLPRRGTYLSASTVHPLRVYDTPEQARACAQRLGTDAIVIEPDDDPGPWPGYWLDRLRGQACAPLAEVLS